MTRQKWCIVQQRFAAPGGNVDYERFLEEVLSPLKKGETISYRRFDCATFTLEPPITMTATELTVIEGAYSMHPELAKHYDLSVFLDISPGLQEKRIRKRNSPELAERFFGEWIPMEERYFEATGARARCDLVIGIDEKNFCKNMVGRNYYEVTEKETYDTGTALSGVRNGTSDARAGSPEGEAQ